MRIERCSWEQEGVSPRLPIPEGEGVAGRGGEVTTSLTNTWYSIIAMVWVYRESVVRGFVRDLKSSTP